MNVDALESDLERMPVEELEGVFGKGTVLEVGRAVGLREALLTWPDPPPLELLPYLMMALLVVLILESLLGNRFSPDTYAG